MSFRRTHVVRVATALTAAVALSSQALAHHPAGGMMPTSLFEGLASGLAHPVIGLDHFAFIIGVGLVAASLGRVFSLPLAFIGGTLAGCAIHLASVTLPGAELVIAASVVAAGALVAAKARLSSALMTAFAAVAGIAHGWAYGEGIFGAEQGALVAYLIGFVTIQAAIAVGTALIARAILTRPAPDTALVRIAGAVVLGIGIAVLTGHVEAIAFPGIAQ